MIRKNMQREKRMIRKFLLLIIASIGLFSGSIFAVGLGEISQDSGLNQPLLAEIPLLSAGDLAEYEVKASLASNKEFNKVGVERIFFLNKLRFETVRSKDGRITIKVTTRALVKEPFLNFVVELNWPNGRILREYTLLLDPPVFEESASSTINKTQTQPPTPEVSQINHAAESSTPPSRFKPAKQEPTRFSGTTYGPVSEADTLWAIALRVRQDRSLSVQQTVVAIYRANPDAFYRGNINNLSKGKVLQIPDSETIRNVPKRAALQDVVLQNRQWREGGARKILDRRDSRQSATSKQSGEARLSLSAANGEGDAQGYGSDSSELSEVKDALKQERDAKAKLEAEVRQLKAKLANQGAIEDDSAVQIQDAELAVLAKESEKSSDIDSNSDQNQALDLDASEINEEHSEANDTPETINNPQTLVDQQKEKDTTATPVIHKKILKKKSMLDEMLENPMILYGVPGALLVIILLIVFWRNKKRMEDEEFQFDLVSSAGAGSMNTTETFDLPDVGDDMLVELDMDDDENESAKSDDFDPIGEADIYIAYGKHEQAETLLLEAIEDNPIRSDLKVKLMECYSESDEQDKFEELALEVADAVDADEWVSQINDLRAKAWGGSDLLAIEDDNFELPETKDVFAQSEDGLDIDFGDEDIETSGESEELILDDTEQLDDTFDGDMDTLAGFDSDDDLGDIDNLELTDDSQGATIDGTSNTLETSGSVDLTDTIDGDEDINFDEDDFALDMDDDDMDFDDSIGDEGDEIATKLDLARAYVDMGDSEGAKEILKEVVAEGNESQKMEAQALIDKA
ncbi:MAG: FimV/HubP family polar landmark protein [Enterobacterales bacterium]|nr:FimV/HubP family polar landmark protein [Enterobacterales bacterium]